MSKRNLADWDRWLRVAVGILLLIVGFFGGLEGLNGAALRIFGWLPLLTGLLGWDPVYAFFGWRTNSSARRE